MVLTITLLITIICGVFLMLWAGVAFIQDKGEMLITIMASLAQQESESLSQNVRMGQHYRFQQGKPMVASNFMGYRIDDFFQRTDRCLQAERIDERYIEKVIVKRDGLTVVFKAGITI